MGKRLDSRAFGVPPPRKKRPNAKNPKPRKRLPKKRAEPRVKTMGKVVGGQKLIPIVEDRAYLTDMYSETCFLTGHRASFTDPVEPMHVGNPGKNLKNDCEALPALHSVHALTHQHGITAILPFLEAQPHLLLAMLRAYARERYRITKGLPL